MELVDDIRRVSEHLYVSKEGHETIQQQWMSLCAAQHPLSHAERVPQILHFVCNFRVDPCRIDTM